LSRCTRYNGDAPAAEVPAVGADQAALADGDSVAHADEDVEEVLTVRDAEVVPFQVEVAACRFVVDRVAVKVFVVVDLEVVVH
jgi:hypothetical protein